MTSPFIATPASQDPLGGSDNLTTEGGNCYNFTIAGEYDPHLPANGVPGSNTIQARLLPFPCFNKPPIINNPTLDVPWPTPPPVETGCRPLRARATTTMDEDLPEGLIAEFVDSPAPDKCFPILDLKLNINTIVDQVISIIVPGSGGGGGVIGGIQYNQYGCCCDEYGSFYLSTTINGDGNSYGAGCYNGDIGSCMGAYLPVGCAGAYNAPAATTGGIGVRWDNKDHGGVYDSAHCSLIEVEGWSACCAGAISRFEKPQVVGVGRVGEPVGPCIGDGYYVDVISGTTFHGQGAGTAPDLPVVEEGVEMTNIYETDVGNGYGNCTDGRMVPGIAGTVVNASYPANFVPQRICPGTVVTVFGITQSAAEQNGMYPAGLLENSVSRDCTSCLGNAGGVLMWFQAENAHDMGCNEDEANCDGLALGDGTTKSADTYTAPGTRFGRGDWYQGGGGSNIVKRAGRRDQYKKEQGE